MPYNTYYGLHYICCQIHIRADLIFCLGIRQKVSSDFITGLIFSPVSLQGPGEVWHGDPLDDAFSAQKPATPRLRWHLPIPGHHPVGTASAGAGKSGEEWVPGDTA